VEIDEEVDGVEDDEDEVALREKGQSDCLWVCYWLLVTGCWFQKRKKNKRE
jgi:hypothetical protein